MVRLERQGDTFVLVTGSQRQDASVLINAISELNKNSPDISKIREGLSYLESSTGIDIRKEIKAVLLKVVGNNPH